MSDKLYKMYRGEIKSVDETNYSVKAVISDETVDRYDEVILASAWKKRLGTYKMHPVLLSSHNYGSLQNQIGELQNIKVNSDRQLEATIKYYVGEGNMEADWGFKLAQKGIAAFSVGFIPHCSMCEDDMNMSELLKDTKIPKDRRVRRVFTDVELLENSQVVVPANPSALQKSLMNKDVDPIVKEMTDEIKEAFKVESVIDKMAELLTNSDINDADRKKQYDIFVKEYILDDIDAPECKLYSKNDDVLSGCKDIATSVKIMSILYWNEIKNIEKIINEEDDMLEDSLKQYIDEAIGKALKDLEGMLIKCNHEVIKEIASKLSVREEQDIITEIEKEELELKEKSNKYIDSMFDAIRSLKTSA